MSRADDHYGATDRPRPIGDYYVWHAPGGLLWGSPHEAPRPAADEAAPAPCLDCERVPCRCAEWEECMRRSEEEEATRAAAMAEAEMPHLWHRGPDGLLRRNPA